MSLRRIVVCAFHTLLIGLSLGAICLAQTLQVRPKPKPRPIQGSVAEPPVLPTTGNWSQLAKLSPGPGGFTIYFASRVAVSGDTAVVGTEPTVSNSRAAYVFLRQAQGWRNAFPVAALSLPSPANIEDAPVAIDGDTVVVGSPSFSAGSTGYAYVYVKPPGGWVDMKPTATLTASDSVDGYFGASVGISGNTIVVGDASYGSVGAAYVYVKSAGRWSNMTETAKLAASDGLPDNELGYSAAISGTTIVLGAPEFNGGSGKAYVYVEPAAGWSSMTQTAELSAQVSDSEMGASVAIDGDIVLAGAPEGGSSGYGAAYLFEKPAAGWRDMIPTATLQPGDVQEKELFGDSVGISGRIVIVGAPVRSLGTMEAEGGIYVFEEPQDGWKNMSSATVLTGSDARYGGWFGYTAAIDGGVVVGGAPYFREPGAAYVFGLP